MTSQLERKMVSRRALNEMANRVLLLRRVTMMTLATSI